jgi:hypothetical protein
VINLNILRERAKQCNLSDLEKEMSNTAFGRGKLVEWEENSVEHAFIGRGPERYAKL